MNLLSSEYLQFKYKEDASGENYRKDVFCNNILIGHISHGVHNGFWFRWKIVNNVDLHDTTEGALKASLEMTLKQLAFFFYNTLKIK